jgi:putative ATP-dependent endonuclease of OLD family
MSDAQQEGTHAVALQTDVADLVVSRLVIDDFRGIDHADLLLDRGTTFLVGENNSGKSSILSALSVAFGSRRAMSDDLRRRGGDQPITQSTIDVYLSPRGGTEFTERTRQQLQVVQREPGPALREIVAFRTRLTPSSEGSLLLADRRFLQPARGNGWVDSQTAWRPQVLDLVDVHLLDASRDLMSELGSQASSWGRVVADLQVPELPKRTDGMHEPLGREGLEDDLKEIAKRLRRASPVLTQLEGDLRRLSNTQTTVGSVELVALPPRIDELARTIEVVINQRDNTSLPLRFHGLGSRSLAALLVFQTLCTLRVGADQGVRPLLVTLLEEPESHLHPQAVVALRDILDYLPGQRVVTTHSPHLVAEVSPQAVRLVRRSAEGTRILGLPPETAKRIAQFRRFVERPLGEIFFARLVVFGDGTTERNTLPVLLRPLLGCDAAGLGITFIDCEGMDSPKLTKVIQALHDLEIPWLLFVDHDRSGGSALAGIADPDTGEPLNFDHGNVIVSGIKQMEQLLVDAGYQAEIESVAMENGTTVDGGAKPHLQFLAGNKSWAPEAVARKAIASGKEVPEPIRKLATAIHTRIDRHPEAPDGSTP